MQIRNKYQKKGKKLICRAMKFGEIFKTDLNFQMLSRDGLYRGPSLIMVTKGARVSISTD